MMMLVKAFVACLVLVGGLAAAPFAAAANVKTLVLVDDLNTQNTHDIFFASLRARGHALVFSHAYASRYELESFGEYHFDNLILFAPTAIDFGTTITKANIIAFIDSGRNVLVAASSTTTPFIREIANECGVDFDEPYSSVIDHTMYDLSDTQGEHTLVASDVWTENKVILGETGPSAPVLFRGIGHASREDSTLVYNILTGAASAYSHAAGSAVSEYPQSAAESTLLVSVMQARNSARVVFAGSLDMFSDALFVSPVHVAGTGKKHARSGNQEFCVEVSKWLFQERGVLKAENLLHRKVGDTTVTRVDGAVVNPGAYRVKDEIEVSVEIKEYDVVADEWRAFTGDDVQLELFMIDPYIRTTLQHDSKGTYFTSFRVPDVYGIYKFKLHYQSSGYSELLLEQQVSVHPFKHDAYPRFLIVAYPYYCSALTLMAAFLLFGVVFLYGDHSDNDRKQKQQQSKSKSQ